MRLLFCCLGNICRSPTAYGVMRSLALRERLDLEIDSCGTGGHHAGEPPYPPAVIAARARGFDLSDLRARRLRTEDFSDFDLILAMDRQNRKDIAAVAPAGAQARIALYLEEAGLGAGAEVPDTYYTGAFDTVLRLIEQASARLVARWQAEGRL